jgi:serine/threonine protein kinase
MLTEGDYPVEFGRYTLLGILGEGAMARVYRAELRGPGGFTKPTALKIVRGSVASRSAALRDALLNEARLGGLLDHPNLVQTLDYGVVDGLPFIAMGHVRGVGLDLLLGSAVDIPPEVALEIVLQIALGLDHAHHLHGDDEMDGGLVHRDLKPSNIILDHHGLARVLDFGIAKAAAASVDATAVGVTKGTPAYMSPEQANGLPLDRRSDIFSLGVLLHELVTRERMFAASTPLATLHAVTLVDEQLSEPGFEERINAIVPGLGPIVSRCLRASPDLRYSTCADLERDLRAVADSFTPAPLLRGWVADVRDALGLGHHDPAGLSLDTPLFLSQPSAFGPDGRPRSLDQARPPADDSDQTRFAPPDRSDGHDEDDVATDAPMPAVPDSPPSDLPDAAPAPEPPSSPGRITANDLQTRPMTSAMGPPDPPPPRRWGRSGIALVAFGAVALAVVGALWQARGPAPTTDTFDAPGLAASLGEPGLSDPLPETAPTEVVAAPTPPRPSPTPAPTTGSAPTPRPTVGPEAPAAEPPPALGVQMQMATREGGTTKVVVTARLRAAADSKLWIHYKRPIGPWQKKPLSSMGPGGWFRMIEFAGLPPGATLRWYVTAEIAERDGSETRVRAGSRNDPRRYTLPRS